MRRLFVVPKDQAFAINTKIDFLAKGQIGVYGMNRDTNLFEPYHIDGVYDFLQVFQGGKSLGSPTFDVNTNKFTRFTKVDARSAVANVWRWTITKDTVGPNDTFTLVASVRDNIASPMDRYEPFSVSAGKKSKEQIYEAMAKEVCCSRYFEATADKAGVLITTKKDFHYPFVAGGQFVKAADECYVCNTGDVHAEEVVPWGFPSGTPEQIQALDEELVPETGVLVDFYDRMMPRPETFKAADNVGKSYNVYTLESANFNNDGGDNGREAFEIRHYLYVAFETSGTAENMFVKSIETGLGLTLQSKLRTSAFVK